MSEANNFFTKGERELLYDILTGQAVGTKGVKISCFRRKIENKLTLLAKEVPNKSALDLIIYRKANKQDVWLAASQVCEDERPGLFERLKTEQTVNELIAS